MCCCAISTDKSLYHCFGCRAAGSVVDWMMKTQSISQPKAIALLRNEAGVDSGKTSSVSGCSLDLEKRQGCRTAYKASSTHVGAGLKMTAQNLACIMTTQMTPRGRNDNEHHPLQNR
ncbi:CHC2 zinc finger domain-containing protein [Serratia fonticola]|uniref:CHC2 zinc finger domain-containing protein n=1 Tax=Serratia fonticola TaxID=47917 RepID=UPI001FBB5B7D|nr:CHC2 zinc finger domain-containing protein [Serratia fonticola]